jgi:hypothetical protein
MENERGKEREEPGVGCGRGPLPTSFGLRIERDLQARCIQLRRRGHTCQPPSPSSNIQIVHQNLSLLHLTSEDLKYDTPPPHFPTTTPPSTTLLLHRRVKRHFARRIATIVSPTEKRMACGNGRDGGDAIIRQLSRKLSVGGVDVEEAAHVSDVKMSRFRKDVAPLGPQDGDIAANCATRPDDVSR